MSGAQTVIDLIVGGALDEHIDLIVEVSRKRAQIVAERKAVNLEPGDQFYIQNISPKKLDGRLVEFLEHKDNSLRCRLLERVDTRYTSGMTILLRRSHVGMVRSK